MSDRPPNSFHRAEHWETVYVEKDPLSLSWYQEEPTLSLGLFDALGIGPASAAIDVGGGESHLVDRLLARGFTDVTVLDIAHSAIGASQQRIGSSPRVAWIVDDLLTWQPQRRFALWHDRAVFHFLAGPEIDAYRELLDRALSPQGAVILATFAPDGPEYCSGLRVSRYGVDDLVDVLGAKFNVVAQKSEHHETPQGATQSFTWVAARRRA